MPSSPIIIHITVIFIFPSFVLFCFVLFFCSCCCYCCFNSLARSSYLSFFSLSFSFTLWSAGTAKSPIRQVLFFCFFLFFFVVWPRLDNPFVPQNLHEFCASHFLGQILGWAYTSCSYFLSNWFSGTIAITNSDGERASPWMIPLWIFTSDKLFPSAVSSTLRVSMVFSINFLTSPDSLYILKQCIRQFYGIIFLFRSQSEP